MRNWFIAVANKCRLRSIGFDRFEKTYVYASKLMPQRRPRAFSPSLHIVLLRSPRYALLISVASHYNKLASVQFHCFGLISVRTYFVCMFFTFVFVFINYFPLCCAATFMSTSNSVRAHTHTNGRTYSVVDSIRGTQFSICGIASTNENVPRIRSRNMREAARSRFLPSDRCTHNRTRIFPKLNVLRSKDTRAIRTYG